jgi:hypothetical protein
MSKSKSKSSCPTQKPCDESVPQEPLDNETVPEDREEDCVTRQSRYMKYVAAHLEELIPLHLRHRFCLLFGTTVISDFATCAEAENERNQNPHVALCLYAPYQDKPQEETQ